MNKEEIKSLLSTSDWYDISIQKNAIGEVVLILVCRNDKQVDDFYSLLSTEGFTYRGFAKDKSDKYVLRLYFGDDIIMHCTTTRTIADYPQLLWVEQGLAELITAGMFIGVNESGMSLYSYKAPFSHANRINLN